MKFYGRLLVLVSILALFMVGCEDTQRVEKAQMDREALVSAVSRSTERLSAQAQSLQAENDRLRTQIQNLQTQIILQEKSLEDMTSEVNSLRESVTGAATAIQKERAASSSEGNDMNILGFLVIVIVVIIIIYLLYRVLRPSPIEDEDDEDFSTFDDDFGFEDEEDFGDEGLEEEDEDKK
ncbi:hypothetical protein KQI84_11785 [bacterium]|nr:hypothetical protein [bacterium]